AQRRRVLDPRAADPAGCSGGRLRLGRPGDHGRARRLRARGRRSGGLHLQHADDRGARREPGGGHRSVLPRAGGAGPRRVRPGGALRCGCRDRRAGRRARVHPGQRGAVRDRCAEQGHQRRGGCRARLRHRRAQRRGRGRGDRLPRGGGGRERVSDHHGGGRGARRARPGVRRPGRRRGGAVDPRRVRLRPGMRSLPAWILAPAVLGALFVLLPLAAMAARVDWSEAGTLLTSESSLSALRLSVPTSGAIALLYTFGRQGLLGRQLELLGIEIAFSTTAVVLAQTFVALPFLVISLEGALRTAGTRYEVAAASLGAGPSRVMLRVTLPLVLP